MTNLENNVPELYTRFNQISIEKAELVTYTPESEKAFLVSGVDRKRKIIEVITYHKGKVRHEIYPGSQNGREHNYPVFVACLIPRVTWF
ncbi:MAG: hypothetical protein ABIR06_10375 [Cyclobacteriaceae bacterium]